MNAGDPCPRCQHGFMHECPGNLVFRCNNQDCCGYFFPKDYEVCGTCGYDHEYDGENHITYQAIKQAHEEEEE